EPPLALRDGGLIREGWNPELRELKHSARAAKDWIASLEPRERERTGIGSLRVRFNRVFGYSIEVSNAHAAKVPPDYLRRQTLVGAERDVTAELKEYASRVLGAEERSARLEFGLFGVLRSQVAARSEDRRPARVGAPDNLARGQSTFLVEKVETASILHHATARSVILLDEVRRGTSTFHGLAIACAVTEELHERGHGAKALFATHYPEL